MNSFRPHFPRSLIARPKFIQMLIFAVGVHSVKEAIVAICHELTFSRETFQWLSLEDALRTAEVIKYASVENEKAGTDQTIRSRLFHEALNLPFVVGFEHSEAGDWR